MYNLKSTHKTDDALTGEKTTHTFPVTDVITGKESTESVKSSWRKPKQ